MGAAIRVILSGWARVSKGYILSQIQPNSGSFRESSYQCTLIYYKNATIILNKLLPKEETF